MSSEDDLVQTLELTHLNQRSLAKDIQVFCTNQGLGPLKKIAQGSLDKSLRDTQLVLTWSRKYRQNYSQLMHDAKFPENAPFVTFYAFFLFSQLTCTLANMPLSQVFGLYHSYSDRNHAVTHAKALSGRTGTSLPIQTTGGRTTMDCAQYTRLNKWW